MKELLQNTAMVSAYFVAFIYLLVASADGFFIPSSKFCAVIMLIVLAIGGLQWVFKEDK